MKKSFCLCAMMVVLSFSAQATLIGDSISGSAVGMTYFSGGTVVVSGFTEFYGTVDGGGGAELTVDFDFGPDSLLIYMESDQSGTTYPTDFTVTFTDLNWAPGYILTGIVLNFDDPLGTGEGLTPTITDDSLTLDFAAFPVPEFREIELGLIFELDNGGPSNPVPEPATMTLLGIGLVGLLARQKRRRV